MCRFYGASPILSVTARSWQHAPRNWYKPRPNFEKAVEESHTEYNSDIYLQYILPHVKNLVTPDYPKCELVVSSINFEELPTFFLVIPESKHFECAEYKEYVCPEHQVPQL